MPYIKTNLKQKKIPFLMSMPSNVSAAAPFCSASAGNLSFYKESPIPAHPSYHIICPIHFNAQINQSRS